MSLPPAAIKKLEDLEKRVQELSGKLADPDIAVDPNKTRVIAKERGRSSAPSALSKSGVRCPRASMRRERSSPIPR